jgi:biotin transport system ATP-binding protein
MLFSIKNLTKTFSDEITALDNVSFDIAEGECIVVSGANGSGKTVLMHILAALDEPTSGEVFYKGAPLFGKNAKKETLQSLRCELGIVFQDADSQIIGETVREDTAIGPENLKLPNDEVQSRVKAALEAVQLTKKAESLPGTLSGGEKRRLAVAGVLAMGGKTVIFDEPFANLDFPGVVDVLKIIQKLKNEGCTLLILTHELEKVLAFADRLLILFRGKLEAEGKPEEVLNGLRAEWGVRDPRGRCESVEECCWL